jgi:hypothetical protein
VAGPEPLGRLNVDERITGQSPDGTAPGAGIAEGMPGWQEVRIVRSGAYQRPVVNAIDQVLHMLRSWWPAASARRLFISKPPTVIGPSLGYGR